MEHSSTPFRFHYPLSLCRTPQACYICGRFLCCLGIVHLRATIPWCGWGCEPVFPHIAVGGGVHFLVPYLTVGGWGCKPLLPYLAVGRVLNLCSHTLLLVQFLVPNLAVGGWLVPVLPHLAVGGLGCVPVPLYTSAAIPCCGYGGLCLCFHTLLWVGCACAPIPCCGCMGCVCSVFPYLAFIFRSLS